MLTEAPYPDFWQILGTILFVAVLWGMGFLSGWLMGKVEKRRRCGGKT